MSTKQRIRDLPGVLPNIESADIIVHSCKLMLSIVIPESTTYDKWNDAVETEFKSIISQVHRGSDGGIEATWSNASEIVQKTCERCLVILSGGYTFPTEHLDEDNTINSVSDDPSTVPTTSTPTTPSQQERKEGRSRQKEKQMFDLS